jgi:hypothetical protein
MEGFYVFVRQYMNNCNCEQSAQDAFNRAPEKTMSQNKISSFFVSNDDTKMTNMSTPPDIARVVTLQAP